MTDLTLVFPAHFLECSIPESAISNFSALGDFWGTFNKFLTRETCSWLELIGA